MPHRHNNKSVATVRKGTAIAECKRINNSSYSIERDIGSALRLVSACAKCLQFAQFYQAIINFPFTQTHNANKMYSVHTMNTLRNSVGGMRWICTYTHLCMCYSVYTLIQSSIANTSHKANQRHANVAPTHVTQQS